MPPDDTTLNAARAGDNRAFASVVAPYRAELRAHCYRMSGSLHDAEDLLQESLLRAWRGLPRFEGRSSLRTWLYAVTTSACIDALDRKSARLLPMDLGPAVKGDEPIGPPTRDPIWIEPCPESLYSDGPTWPDARYSALESVRLAFLVALQTLPPRQRAVLILRDVLGWQASECAQLLDSSVPSVNSALQRARDTLASRGSSVPASPDDAETKSLLARYVQAWERSDVAALVSLLHEDATLAMPPMPQWIRGAIEIGKSMGAMVLTPEASGRYRLVPLRANGEPGFAVYSRDASTGSFGPQAVHIVSLSQRRVVAMTAFLDSSLLGLFGLPATLPATVTP